MPDLIFQVLPFAVGVFASPLPVIVGILMVFTPEPRSTAAAYCATWTAGVTLATIAFALIAGVIDMYEGSRTWAAWLQVVLGLLLLVLALKTWRGRSQGSPAWLDKVMNAGPREAVRLGVLLSIANPKELVMALAAGIVIGNSEVGLAGSAAALVVFVVVGASSVFGPVLLFFAAGRSSLSRLEAAREWLQRHSVAVASVVLAAIAVFLIVGGVVKLRA